MRRIHASVLLLLVGCNFGTMTPADTALDEDGSSDTSGDGGDETATMPATTQEPASTGGDGEEGESGDSGESDGSGSDGASESDDASDSSTGEQPDWAMTFDGNDEASTAMAVPQAALASEFTVEAWFFASPALRGVMIDTRNAAPGTVGWVLYVEKDEPRRIVFGYNGASSGASVIGPDAADLLGGWHHVAATRDGGGLLTMWIDGEEAATISDTPDPVEVAVPVRVGRFFDTAYDYWLRGSLDDIHVSSVARYDDTFVPAAAEVDEDSALLWTFEEGSGSAFDLVNGVELVVDGAVWEEREA